MTTRHGDIAMSPEEIEEEAIAALNADRQGEVLAAELRQLMKKNGAPGVVTPYQLLREWARRKVNEGKVDDAISKTALQRYIRGFNKARTAFVNALLKRDAKEAIKQKQAQMINHALLAEGKKVADEVNIIKKRMERYAKTAAMKSIDQDYMDRIHELLEGYNFRDVTDTSRAERASFETWAAAQQALNSEVLVPERFRDERTNWKDAKVSKLLELNDMVQSLVHLGKLKQTLSDTQNERNLRETLDDVKSRIEALPPRAVPETSIGNANRPFRQSWREAKTGSDYRRAIGNMFRTGTGRSIAAALIKFEGLLDLLDGTKDGTGPLNQTVFQTSTNANNAYSKLLEEVMAPLVERLKATGKKYIHRMNETVTIQELTLNVSISPSDTERLGQPLTVSRSQLIGMLLNTGNLSNFEKMLAGEKWSAKPESAAEQQRVRDILISYASKEDMDLVQDVWDGVQKLWPHIAKVEREMSGIVPEEVVRVDFDTKYGPYRGGYWPVVWDSSRSEMGQTQGEEAEKGFGIGGGIGTHKGHTITRTNASAPMEYRLEHVLFGHLNKVISRIAYAPWVRDTLKILDNKEVKGLIDLRMGEEYVDMIKPWMRDQIPSSIVDTPGSTYFEKKLDGFRINMSIAVLGVSYSTGVAQTMGLAYSAGVLGEGNVADGPKWVAVGLQQMLALQKDGMGGAQEFVFARSEEMQRRAREINQEAIDVFKRLKDNDTAKHKLQAAAFWHIGFIDLNMVSIPTWLGGYHKALSQGLSDAEASAYGDKVVRLSQGSGRKKDQSAIQRGTTMQKFVATFYTPSSVFFNQQWEAAQHFKAGNWSKALAPTFWFLTVTTLIDAIRGGDWPPEDDEEDGLGVADISEWASRNMFTGLFYGVPIARDVAETTERKIRGEYAEYGTTPISMLFAATERGVATGEKIYNGEEISGRDIKNAANMIGFTMGLPTNQPGKTGGYVYDVYSGKEDPDSAYDWYHGLAYGKPPKEEEQ